MKTMMLMRIIVLIVGFFGLASAAGTWGYGKTNGEVYGPSDWGHVSEDCNGRAQSPVNIVRDEVKDDDDDDNSLRPLRVNFQYVSGTVKGTLVNNGHSPTFNVEKGGASVINPVNGQKYVLAQFHFHFGCTDDVGSEHTIDGKSYPGELHLVFYNAKYDHISTAATKSDGLTVIGVFLNKSYFGLDYSMYKLTRSIRKIKAEGAKVSIYVKLERLIRGLSSGSRSYYTYKGSLTTPGCYESVRWVVLKSPISVNQNDLNIFRSLQATHGYHHGKMCNNYRPTLPLNGRKVYGYESYVRVVDNETKTVNIIDMSCPWIENRKQKDQEKTTKYAPLRLELKQQHKGYTKDVLGAYSSETRENVKLLLGKTKADKTLFNMQKSVISSKSDSGLRGSFLLSSFVLHVQNHPYYYSLIFSYQLAAIMLLTTIIVGMAVIFGPVSASESWRYGKTSGGVYGPADWGHVSRYCNGRAQSPVNIIRDNIEYDDDDDDHDLRVSFANAGGLVTGTLVDNGHSPTLKVDRSKGGASVINPVNGQKYVLVQFHFHFGCTDNVGSEHTIDGKPYPGELHLVFYNAKYGDFSTAATKTDGLTVIGVFLKKGSSGGEELKTFSQNLRAIIKEGSQKAGVAAKLDHLVPGLSSGNRSYYTYKGSLTTPGCYESVRWVVLRTPITADQEIVSINIDINVKYRDVVSGEMVLYRRRSAGLSVNIACNVQNEKS
ncbi:uncharacterized protein LOC116306277 [Actinia tenebrosa]|uniref:Carbonic anhydrase n=1 Tax=Actinia tenebrosa TaxID=6105 RepID=A0A6P8IXM9_ACTTE|nr:uncharacterized protein LOC116306277 [Actinia tenebrosa]